MVLPARQVAARRPSGRRIAAAVAVAAAFAAAPSQAQQITMKFATQTINDVQHEFIKVYKTELEKATNGRMQVGVYPASQLGGQQRQTEGLRLGTIEAAIGPGELFAGADPRFGGLALAGLFNDNEHTRRVMALPEVRKALSDVASSRNLLLLAVNVYGPQAIVFKTPVTSLPGFSGKRIRVLATESEQAMIKALGGAPVPMSLPEVLPALQQGTLDGVNAVLGVFVAFKYQDVAPNLLDTAFVADRLAEHRQQGLVQPAAARSAKGCRRDRREGRARNGQMADRAPGFGRRSLDVEGRQGRIPVGGRAARRGAARHRGDPTDPRQGRRAQNVLRHDQERRGQGEVRRLFAASSAGLTRGSIPSQESGSAGQACNKGAC